MRQVYCSSWFIIASAIKWGLWQSNFTILLPTRTSLRWMSVSRISILATFFFLSQNRFPDVLKTKWFLYQVRQFLSQDTCRALSRTEIFLSPRSTLGGTWDWNFCVSNNQGMSTLATFFSVPEQIFRRTQNKPRIASAREIISPRRDFISCSQSKPQLLWHWYKSFWGRFRDNPKRDTITLSSIIFIRWTTGNCFYKLLKY